MRKYGFKRTCAGILAVLTVAGFVPGNVGGLLPAGIGVTASADEEELYFNQLTSIDDLPTEFPDYDGNDGIDWVSNNIPYGDGYLICGIWGESETVKYILTNAGSLDIVDADFIANLLDEGETVYYVSSSPAMTDISGATVNLDSDHSVVSLTVGETTLTDLSGFVITYGTDDNHTAAEIPEDIDVCCVYVTAAADSDAYIGTAKSAEFAVKALTFDELEEGQVIKAGTTVVFRDGLLDDMQATVYRQGSIPIYYNSRYTLEKDAVIRSVSTSTSSSGDRGYITIVERDDSFKFVSPALGVFQSNNQAYSSTAAISEFTLTSDQEETLAWTVSSEANYDYLSVCVDGEVKVYASGEQSGTISLSAGTHYITAAYWKDSSSDTGDDCATLRNAKLKAIVNASDLTFGLDGVSSDGTIQFYAEEGASYTVKANVSALIPFTREDMLNALGMDEDGLDIVDENSEDKTIAHLSAASDAEAVRKQEGFVLPVTFTVVPVMDEAAGSYATGSGSFRIGGNRLELKLYEPPAASTTTAALNLEDCDDADFVVDFTNEDGEEVTGGASGSEMIEAIEAKVGSEVTIHTMHPIRMGYTYGFEQRRIEAEVGTDDDGMMTYTFTMPGFDVDVFYLYGELSTEENGDISVETVLVFSGNQNAFEIQPSQIQPNNILHKGDNGNYISNLLHVGEKVTVVSVDRLSMFLNGKPLAGVTEDYGEVVGYNSYIYTISEMPEGTVSVVPYTHVHEYTYEVQGNQLIRTCHNEDSCGEDNEAVVIAELCNDYSSDIGNEKEEYKEKKIREKIAKKVEKVSASAKVNVAPPNYNGRLDTASSELIYHAEECPSEVYYPTSWTAGGIVISYFTVGMDGSESVSDSVPLHVGSYVARAQVFVDTDQDPETEPEVFELELPYVINPAELTEENVHLEGWSFWQQNIDFNDPSHIIFTGQITGPSFHVTPYNSHNDNEERLEEDRDYIVYGERSAYNPGHYTFYVEGVGDFTGVIPVEWQLGDDDMIAITPDMFEVEVEYYKGIARAIVSPTDERLADCQFKFGGTMISKTAGEFSICIQPKDSSTTGTVDLTWNADADKLIESAASLVELESSAVISQNKQRVYTGFTASVANGYTIADYGLIYCQNGTAAAAEQLTLETVDNVSVKKAKYYRANITDNGLGVAAVGFITVADAAGNTKTLYTDVMGGSFKAFSEAAAAENVSLETEDVYGLSSQGKEKVYVGFSANLKSGYTVEDYGLIYCQNGTAATAAQLTLEAVDNTNVKKAKYYRANITDHGYGVAAVGFVKVKDENGYVTTLYTDVMKNASFAYETVQSVLSQGKQKVFVGFSADLGVGYTVEDYGLIYCQNGTAATTAQLTLEAVDNTNVKKAKYYRANIADNGSGVAAVGFVTIKDAAGHESTVYTQVMRGAYGA